MHEYELTNIVNRMNQDIGHSRINIALNSKAFKSCQGKVAKSFHQVEENINQIQEYVDALRNIITIRVT